MNQFFVTIIVILISSFFFWFSGKFADWLTPKILNWFKRWKARDCTYLSRCPMLECKDTGCYYFDKECLACKFSEESADEQ